MSYLKPHNVFTKLTFVQFSVPKSCNEVPEPTATNTVTQMIDSDGPGGNEPLMVGIYLWFSTAEQIMKYRLKYENLIGFQVQHTMKDKFHNITYDITCCSIVLHPKNLDPFTFQ